MLIREEKRRRFQGVLLVLVLSGILGNLFGVLLGALLPQGALHDAVAMTRAFGLDTPFSVDLWILSLSFGINVKLNSCGLLFMLLGLILYKKA